jgi:hypothetical protein
MASDPLNNRDSLGRIIPDPNSPHPFAEWKAPGRNRDGRSERPIHPRRDGEPTISFRVPERVHRAIRLVAQQRGITVTAVMQEALAPVLQPVLQEPERLHDAAFSMPRFRGQPARLPRLEDRLPSGVQNPVPPFDHVGRQQQRSKQRAKFAGTLTDLLRR